MDEADSRADYDSPWKEALELWFPEFMGLLFPQIHSEIDWGRGYEFMDKELQQVVRDAELGRRYADKLIKVIRRDGGERWVLVHLEVQGRAETDFDRRMYIYNYRLYDRYDADVVSLAVLADASPRFRAGSFQRGFWGCRTQFEFPVMKLLDWADDWARLEASENPFALVIMAQLKVLLQPDHQQRKDAKLQLIRLMYQRGYGKARILELFRVIDWIIHLPPELELVFERELMCFEEEQKMPYITSIERIGEQRGIQEGMRQGMQEGMQQGMQQGLRKGEAAVLHHLLQAKFGAAYADAQRDRVNAADAETLLRWSERLFRAETLEQVFGDSA